jgi:CDGSH-type Zn-finger protein
MSTEPSPATSSPAAVTVKCLTDGPVIKETSKSYLCRCGHSANKPFCDGAHKREGFTAP